MVNVELGSLIEQHGYWLLALGCVMEGETVLILAGFAAHRGHLDLAWVIVVGATGGFVGDQFLFWLGRRHGPSVLARFPKIATQAERVHRFCARHPALSIIGVRFAYGMRIAGPILIGGASVSSLRFAALNALGAVLWALGLAAVGWFFGHAAEVVLGEITHVEGWLLLALALGCFAWWYVRRRSKRDEP